MKIKLHTKNKKKYKNKNKKNKKRLRSHKGGSTVEDSLVSEHAEPIMRYIIETITPSIAKRVLSDMEKELISEKSRADGLSRSWSEEKIQKNALENELTTTKITLKETQNQLDEANRLLEDIESIDDVDDAETLQQQGRRPLHLQDSEEESSDGESSDGESSDGE